MTTASQTAQAPINSPFGYRTTAAEVIAGIELDGKVALVTGGYSGLGTETVRALAGAGAHVIIGARRPEAAASDLASVTGKLTILPLDLADPAAIDAFAAAVAGVTDVLHIQINNAAIMACPLARDARGYESQFATNHLGHFQLTARLWPLLQAGRARVVSVSSIGHRLGGLDLDDLQFERRAYDKWLAYGQAKSANALFALELDRRGARYGVRAFAVHPGGIATPLQRHLTMDEQKAMGWYDDAGTLNPLFKTTTQGAATSVWCATAPLLDAMGGVYCEDCNLGELASDPPPRASGVWPHIRDMALAKALWDKSEALTGVAFNP